MLVCATISFTNAVVKKILNVSRIEAGSGTAGPVKAVNGSTTTGCCNCDHSLYQMVWCLLFLYM